MKPIWTSLSAGVLTFATWPTAGAQTIDLAVEVHQGPITPYRTQVVRVVDGIIVPFGAEKWHVLGACSNRPNLKVKVVTGIITPLGGKVVHVVGGPISPYGTKKVCITNANALDRKVLRLLKLVD